MSGLADTLVARLTPPGKAAIATLGLTGPGAVEVLRALFRRAQDRPLPDDLRPGVTYFGRFGDSSAADEVVVYVRETGPEPRLEVHCHGGAEVLRHLQARLEASGVVAIEAATWLRRRTTDDDAEATEILTRCPTVRTAAIALDYTQGAFHRALAEVRSDADAGRLDSARNRAERLVELIPVGQHLDRPWRVALGGAPNVGKSSLANALTGFARSLVSPQPGTTRDVVTVTLALDGWPIELADTAGLRDATESLEAEGIRRAENTLDDADLVLWVLDASAKPVSPRKPAAKRLLVVNKVDLSAAWDIRAVPGALAVSAVTGLGLMELGRAIVDALIPAPPRAGEAVPVTDAARASIEQYLLKLGSVASA